MAELSTLGSVIKTAYEGQTNTNAFTDALQTKLSGIEAGAEVNTVSPGDIPTAPADIGAATAAQGALADTALQSVPAGVAVPDAVAEPTMEEFNALLASLRGAGLIAT